MKSIDQIPIPLLAWYEQNARELPWRKDASPYRVWVSEIMLQQTRVGAVLGYFARFMEALPTIAHLAEVEEDKLLKLWQGLGYYNRARNLQKAAKTIMTDHNGIFPRDCADIRKLSGIGDYTAAAIASICFGEPYPAVDGNLLRISARVAGDFDDILSPSMKKKVTQALSETIPLQDPGGFNQAMMDLGATVCLPNGAPLCETCPLQEFCEAYEKNLVDALPVRQKKKPRRIEERTVFLIFREGKVALRQRESKGLLASLWEFPQALSASEESLSSLFHLDPCETKFIATGKHIFTHIEWHMTAYIAHAEGENFPETWLWADKKDLDETYAIPSAFAGFLPIVEDILEGREA